MNKNQVVKGFSKLSKEEKILWIEKHITGDEKGLMELLSSFWNPNSEVQTVLESFSENTLTNFPMPYGVAPNFLINDKVHTIPMVIEESSVVAAASSAAKFWQSRGGFRAEVLGVEKIGQLHLTSP